MAVTTKISATQAALDLIGLLKERHGEIVLHQSGGCCDGGTMCFLRGEFLLGRGDLKLGEIGSIPYFMQGTRFPMRGNMHFIVDAVPGRGSTFSLERDTGYYFITKLR